MILEEDKHTNNSQNVFVLDTDVYQSVMLTPIMTLIPTTPLDSKMELAQTALLVPARVLAANTDSSSVIGLNNGLGPNDAPSPYINESDLQSNDSDPKI